MRRENPRWSTVVTRRGWCGSGSMLRWLRSMRCACGDRGRWPDPSGPVPGGADVGRVAVADPSADRHAGGGGGGGADLDDLARVVGGVTRRWLRLVPARGPSCGPAAGRDQRQVEER